MTERDLTCFAEGEGLKLHGVRPGAPVDAYASACGFTGAAGQLVLLPRQAGLAGALVGLGEGASPYVFSGLPKALPDGIWALGEGVEDPGLAVLGWGLGAYRYPGFSQAQPRPAARLVVPAGCEAALRALRATWLARDLINTPANLLGPAELAGAAARALRSRGAHVNVIQDGDVAPRYPALHAVGAGSARQPQVVVAHWQAPGTGADAPLVSLCGKGVCFDTGGYDIKPPSGMLRMKKDMGGAAIALGLACMIMEAGLKLRLDVRLGCVENMISGNAMRPGDVLRSRSGLSVEVGNTDAEGRLVLADLLSEACEAKPDMLIDFATLTGAARTALGPDLPALFTEDDGLASLIRETASASHDPVWRLPLWNGYNSWLESGTADLNNVSEKAQAGAVVAALFLQRFVSAGTRWAHFDVYAWNDADRPGRPAGGEAQAMRGAFEAVKRFVTGFDGRQVDVMSC